MENLEDYRKLILVKRDAKELRTIIFGENNINDWDKLIILYTMFLVIQHLYLVYQYMHIIINSGPNDFRKDFINTYMFFYFITNLKGSYCGMIYSISKVDNKLAYNMHDNMKEYFDY
jgi:hypothetical protein